MDMLGTLQVDILNFTGSIYLLFTEMNPEFINFVMDANFPLLGASTAIKSVMVFVNTGMQEFQRLTSLSELGLSDNNISVLPPELVSI